MKVEKEIDPSRVRVVRNTRPYGGLDFELIPDSEQDSTLMKMGATHNRISALVSRGEAGSDEHHLSMKELIKIVSNGPRSLIDSLKGEGNRI